MEEPGGEGGNDETEEGIGLYNKSKGCSTSVALATGPNDEEDEEQASVILTKRSKNYKASHTARTES